MLLVYTHNLTPRVKYVFKQSFFYSIRFISIQVKVDFKHLISPEDPEKIPIKHPEDREVYKYLRKDDLKKSNEDIRAFIRYSTPKKGEPAKY